MLRVLAAMVGVSLSLLVVTGCSGEDDSSRDGSSGASVSPSVDPTASVDPNRVSPTDLPAVPKVKQSKGAIKDASFGDCHSDAGKQTVTGTITSSAKLPRDYVVTVSWINDTSDVLARGVTVVHDVEPGAAQKFRLTADVPKGASTCTFNVVRGSVTG